MQVRKGKWKAAIRTLGRDFCISDQKIEEIIVETEEKGLALMPSYYGENTAEYFYDTCQRKLKTILMKRYERMEMIEKAV